MQITEMLHYSQIMHHPQYPLVNPCHYRYLSLFHQTSDILHLPSFILHQKLPIPFHILIKNAKKIADLYNYQLLFQKIFLYLQRKMYMI